MGRIGNILGVKVAEDDWTPEAIWLKEKGIVTGHVDGTFRPTTPLTRGQLAVALKKFYDVIEKEFKSGK